MPVLPFFLQPGKAYMRHSSQLHRSSTWTAAATMALPLTLRNHSPTPLLLQSVERFALPGPGSLDRAAASIGQSNASAIGGFLSNVTSVVGLNATASSVAASHPRIPDGAQPDDRRDLDLQIPPFGTATSDVETGALLRLTFAADGRTYTIDLPSPSSESQPLHPTDPAAVALDITGVFLPEHAHLSLFPSADLQAWMRHLPDALPLSALSIPGTHNSPTHHRALPSVRCQAVSPADQLANGIRFFDVRVQPDKASDTLALVHSVFPISITGQKTLRDDLLPPICAFLDANPSETLILSLKREGTGDATDADLARILADHYTHDNPRFYTAPQIPTLGAARGKIVLLRRFGLDQRPDYGIDASNWADNTPYDLAHPIAVQDFYQVNETASILGQKLEYATGMLARAAELEGTGGGDPPALHLNFLTASCFWNVDCWPERIAAKLNPGVTRYLCRDFAVGVEKGEARGQGQTGVVVTDWCGADGDWDLIRCIVGMNARLARTA